MLTILCMTASVVRTIHEELKNDDGKCRLFSYLQ